VTIRALHEPFRHTVVRRQRKLRLDGCVAAEAQLRLRFPEQAFVQPAGFLGEYGSGKELCLCGLGFHALAVLCAYQQVSRMALVAGDALQLVFGTIEKLLILGRYVTPQTACGVVCRFAVECENELLRSGQFYGIVSRRAYSVDVSRAGPMARLASCSDCDPLRSRRGVNRLGKFRGLILVAGRTGLGSHIIVRPSVFWSFPGNGRSYGTCGLLLGA
jgi:hypothetical protein